ncbi:hypothetical protein FIBSPDRAFT_520668 [Athelia psychrophila]|uniref:Uncharacterized protein n=1 Tax=Athelia psychrophila TaxID=1759441 RepID=A0A166JTA7_9AGAM|nr:hypothetical protein FIBSPDRAFT_520668 [Fibularhizoctonia sp. CBS 109695]
MANNAQISITVLCTLTPIILLAVGVLAETSYYALVALASTIAATIISSQWGIQDYYTTWLQFLMRVITWMFALSPLFPSVIHPYMDLNTTTASWLLVIIVTTEPIFYIIFEASDANMGIYGEIRQTLKDLVYATMGVFYAVMGALISCLETMPAIPLALAMGIRQVLRIGAPAGPETSESEGSNAPAPPDVSHEMPASHNAPPPYQATAEIHYLIRSKVESFNSHLV